ncbi:uncharacterized protein LOC142981190 isoform X2 [Anticarsia gemmatalis]|uniref:uncharacterized protein LOC142981190 isoform X2 n=1 Tax=Anticarsia gemmatalis TaxID=129554 RepID=UPI003F7579A4
MNNLSDQLILYSSGASLSEPSGSSDKLVVALPTTDVNLDDVKDFSNVCRICATVTELVIPIFSGEGLQNNLADKIQKHLPIKVSTTDVLPQVVCYQCSSTLLAWHELVKCCVQADQALKTKVAADARLAKGGKLIAVMAVSGPGEDQKASFHLLLQTVLLSYLNLLDLGSHLDLEFVCQKCVEKPALSTTESLADHLKYDHSTDVTSEQDLKTFIQNYITFEEVLLSEDSDGDFLESEEKPLKPLPNLFCPFCANVFSSATRLVCHLNKHIEVCIEDGVMCCDVIYRDKKTFVTHVQDAHVDRTIDETVQVCKTCGFTTEDTNELLTHINELHTEQKNDKEKRVQNPKNQKYIPAVCPECNKTFSNKYNMFVHMKSHSDASPTFPCDKCNKTYRNQGNLNTHKRQAHEGILNFLCSECGEAFPTRSARDVHARLHTGLKPYTCTYCDKSFRAKNTLDRHIEIHLNIRRHECEICNKKFRKKTHLTYHVSTHGK